jgi:HD-GYP domain-containing protein (c-di-GMP phosphodiesterase class II)
VADGFDAMTSTRPYRKPRSFKEAVDEVKKYSGSQFNREASEALIKCISPDSLNEARNISKKPLSSLQGELIRSLI